MLKNDTSNSQNEFFIFILLYQSNRARTDRGDKHQFHQRQSNTVCPQNVRQDDGL